MPLKELLQEQFKVKTRSVVNPLSVTSVGTSVTQILPNNPNRLAWLLVNLSPNDIYVGFDNLVSSERGIFVAPEGGSLKLIWNEDFDLVGYEVFCISTGADSPIYLLEIVAD